MRDGDRLAQSSDVLCLTGHQVAQTLQLGLDGGHLPVQLSAELNTLIQRVLELSLHTTPALSCGSTCSPGPGGIAQGGPLTSRPMHAGVQMQRVPSGGAHCPPFRVIS